MSLLRSMLRFAVGGMSAILGMGMLAGCGEDANGDNPQVKVTKADIEACCGSDDGSKNYESCVEAYRTTGKCGSIDIDPNPPVYYGPPAITDAELKACCENREDGMDANRCISEYKSTYQCPEDEPVYAEYGMPMPLEEELKACCENRGDMDAEECAERFSETLKCPDIMDAPDAPLYGPPPITDAELKACCENRADGMPAEACIDEYKSTYQCPEDEPVYAEYGMPMPPNEDIEKCCADRNDGMDKGKCIDEYIETGICPPELAMPDDPPIAVYGPAPVDQALEKCCGDKSGDEYSECVKSYYEHNGCMEIIEVPSVPVVYGPPPSPEPEPE